VKREETQAKDALTATLEGEVSLLERHVAVLEAILRNEPIGIIRLSKLTGLEDYRVRYSLRMLEREGLIKPTPEGAVTTPHLKKILPDVRKQLIELSRRISRLEKRLARREADRS
jgi:predicted transcriptional regulator